MTFESLVKIHLLLLKICRRIAVFHMQSFAVPYGLRTSHRNADLRKKSTHISHVGICSPVLLYNHTIVCLLDRILKSRENNRPSPILCPLAQWPPGDRYRWICLPIQAQSHPCTVHICTHIYTHTHTYTLYTHTYTLYTHIYTHCKIEQ